MTPDTCEVVACELPVGGTVEFEVIGVTKHYCRGHLRKIDDHDGGLPPVEA